MNDTELGYGVVPKFGSRVSKCENVLIAVMYNIN